MATPSLTASPASAASGRPGLDKKTGPFTYVIFFVPIRARCYRITCAARNPRRN
ncbi:hypothetical protein ABIA54_003661 [Pseudomonas sp. EB276 TE3739]|nr:hypothetical protein [Pseudomonas koreensis]